MNSFIESNILIPLFDRGWQWATRRFETDLNVVLYSRNSYRDGTFYPLKSDIDTTLFLDSAETFNPYYELHSKLRKSFPYLGECNYYTPQSLSLIEKHFNSFLELQRDPELLSRLNLTGPTDKTSDSAAFLIYSGINDISNLKRNDFRRKRKWLKHFEVAYRYLGQSNPSILFKSNQIMSEVIFGIAKILSRSTGDFFNLQRALEIGFGSIESKKRKEIFKNSPDLQSYLISLFPEFFYESLTTNLTLSETQAFDVLANLKLACLCLVRSEHFYKNPEMSKLRLGSFLNLLKKLNMPESAGAIKENLIVGLQKSIFVCGFKEKHIIKSASMHPILKVSDEICIKKLTHPTSLGRFDVIVFKRNELLVSHYVWRNQINTHNTVITRSLKNPFYDEEPVATEEILGKVSAVQISRSRRLWILTKCFMARRL